MIEPSDILPSDEDAARRILIAARRIAPCIDTLEKEGEPWKNAVAILRGIAQEVPPPGARRIRSQSVGGAAVSYADPSMWSSQDIADLRSLCGVTADVGIPRGAFPRPSRHVTAAWPEDMR